MIDTWARKDSLDTYNAIKQSAELQKFKSAARENHLSVTRDFSMPASLVWRIGEYSRPGIYGYLELDEHGQIIHFKAFDRDWDAINIWEEGEEWGYLLNQFAKEARQIPLVYVEDPIITKVRTGDIDIPIVMPDTATKELMVIEKHGRGRHRLPGPASTPDWQFWLEFALGVGATLGFFVIALVTLLNNWWPIALLLLALAIVSGLLVFQTVQRYDHHKKKTDV